MLRGRQRSYLKSLCNALSPALIVGKNGITENVYKQIEDLLEARELVKIKLLDNSGLYAKDTAREVCEKLNAEFVQSIGSKFVIYRESKEPIINIPK